MSSHQPSPEGEGGTEDKTAGVGTPQPGGSGAVLGPDPGGPGMEVPPLSFQIETN